MFFGLSIRTDRIRQGDLVDALHFYTRELHVRAGLQQTPRELPGPRCASAPVVGSSSTTGTLLSVDGGMAGIQLPF